MIAAKNVSFPKENILATHQRSQQGRTMRELPGSDKQDPIFAPLTVVGYMCICYYVSMFHLLPTFVNEYYPEYGGYYVLYLHVCLVSDYAKTTGLISHLR